MTTAADILRNAILKKSATSTCAAAPSSNAPEPPAAPGSPETFSAGEFHAKVKPAEGSKGGKKSKKTAAEGVLPWLLKTAGIPKTAARRPGRLDGDEALDKLAKLHSKRKRS
jgi:hypothetical protein